MRSQASRAQNHSLLVVSRPEVIDRPNGLRGYKPTFGETAVGAAFRILVLGDRDRDADSLFGLLIGIPGVRDVDVALLHRLHSSRKKVVRSEPDMLRVAGRGIAASAFQSRLYCR